MKTPNECKRIISRLAFKHGVSPRLITERLLSPDDKRSMLDGEITMEVLDVAVKAWISCGEPDYANGKTKVLNEAKVLQEYERIQKGAQNAFK